MNERCTRMSKFRREGTKIARVRRHVSTTKSVNNNRGGTGLREICEEIFSRVETGGIFLMAGLRLLHAFVEVCNRE